MRVFVVDKCCPHLIFFCLIYLNVVQEYLQGNPLWLQYIKVPLITLGYESNYDVFVKAEGGGLSGQAQAISLGIARALLKVSEVHRLLFSCVGYCGQYTYTKFLPLFVCVVRVNCHRF